MRSRLLCAALLLAHCGGGGASDPIRIEFAGVSNLGVFDASLEADPGGARVWMSYSTVAASAQAPAHRRIGTRVAYSDDRGAGWTDAGVVVNVPIDVPLPLPPPNDVGTWVFEVSSLVYDPNAPAAEAWKLFFHRYLQVNGVRLFEHGWIGLRTAPAPDGPWSTERKLFVGAGYDPANDVTLGPPELDLTTLHPDLAGLVLFTEPGAFATVDGLYLVLHGASLADGRIVLLHLPAGGTDWEYRGAFLTNSGDAADFNADGFSAGDLFRTAAGAIHLAVTATETAPERYAGCLVFEVADLAAATLFRTGGVPDLRLRVDGTEGSFNGAGSYDAAADRAGVVYSEVVGDPTADGSFRLFQSRRRP